MRIFVFYTYDSIAGFHITNYFLEILKSNLNCRIFFGSAAFKKKRKLHHGVGASQSHFAHFPIIVMRASPRKINRERNVIARASHFTAFSWKSFIWSEFLGLNNNTGIGNILGKFPHHS